MLQSSSKTLFEGSFPGGDSLRSFSGVTGLTASASCMAAERPSQARPPAPTKAPAVATPPAVAAQAPAPASRPASQQKVQMKRAELDLYFREGRPTGLLLGSVALMKGMSAAEVAKAAGVPTELVTAMFTTGTSGMKSSSVRRVCQVLGIDLTTMQFSSDQVHVFDLTKVKGKLGAKSGYEVARAVGLLARGGRAAELEVGAGLQAFYWRRRATVVCAKNFRALFIGSRAKSFRIEFILGASWACENREKSLVPVVNKELIGRLSKRDLTADEFDELFGGPDALSWADICAAARVNGVSKAALMKFIESRATELDVAETETARTAAIENRPALRLVETERAA